MDELSSRDTLFISYKGLHSFKTDHPKSSVSLVAQGPQGSKISLFHTLLLGGACCLNEFLRHPAAHESYQKPMTRLIKVTFGTYLSQEIGDSGEEGLLRIYPFLELLSFEGCREAHVGQFCSALVPHCFAFLWQQAL